jgi:hypothetical protein
MDKSYELIDLVSGNLFDAYDRESDALDVLIEIDLEHGPEAVRRFALLRDVDGDSSLIAMEDELVRRVQQEEQQTLTAPGRSEVTLVSSQSGTLSIQHRPSWRWPFSLVRANVGGIGNSGLTLVPGGA